MGSQGLLGLKLAHWWSDPGSGVGGWLWIQVPGSSVGLLMSGAESWGGWLRSLRYPKAGVGLLVGGAGAWGIPGLVPTHWEVELGPGVSDCRTLGVPKLVSTCWWMGLDLRAAG